MPETKAVQKPYKFVQHDAPFEGTAGSSARIFYDKLVAGEKLTSDEKTRLCEQLQVSSYGKTVLASMGWWFYFKAFTSRYWVSYKHTGIREVWALDATSIREANRGMGNPILKIVKLKS